MIPATAPLLGFSSEISWPLGANITNGDFRIWRALNKRPDELHGLPSGRRNSDDLQQNVLPPREPTTTEGIKVAIHPEYAEQTVTIGESLSKKGRMELCNLLKDNMDIFSWKPADMTSVPRFIVEHRLNIREGCQPIRQKRRGHAPNRNKAIHEEVAKLVEVEIMREVHNHDWLSNPVMVKKHDGIWRMCVNFTNLNKSCPKDCYPLPEIDWKVESLCEYPFKGFLDAYKGYHQIQMEKEDEEKIAFHTNQGVFCYTRMLFGLKNAEATYLRLVYKAFEKQIGRNLEVYVEDLVIKSHTEHDILRDIEETFHNLRRINMKLNPKTGARSLISSKGQKQSQDGKYYNSKVRSTSFRPGDFVYRSNKASHAKEGGNLVPKWEGPYEVVEALGKGAYKLRNGSGDVLPRTWNVQDLNKCYL
ncbi:reverse transcriptase domain-containing protein [Tanacetum coccineum]